MKYCSVDFGRLKITTTTNHYIRSMKTSNKLYPLGVIFLLTLMICACGSIKEMASEPETPMKKEYALVIHGGAGWIYPGRYSPEEEKAFELALNNALDAGETVLKNGGSALDAVEATVRIMEDDSLFNAGKGSVFSHEETNTLDASIMDGRDLSAGAVGGVTKVKNPVTLARAVKEKSVHVLLTGEGAEEFALDQELELVDPEYFKTSSKWKAIQKIKSEEKGQGAYSLENDYKYGTVGAVALDKEGNIAAATSTGGMTNKRWGRFGDVPIIGAGLYANNQTCGVSCTGHGEYFIRYAVAHEVSAQMEHAGATLQSAAQNVIQKKLVDAGGVGGLIAIDKNGQVVMEFNSKGMFRGYALPGERKVAMYNLEK